MRISRLSTLLLLWAALAAGLNQIARAEVVTVINAGFELPALADDEFERDPPGWINGYYDLAAPSVWLVEDAGSGTYNPSTSAGYGGVAPEGQNIMYAYSYVGFDGGMSQILSDTLQANTRYDLSVLVGNPVVYNGGLTADYRIELVADGDVLAFDTGASPADDSVWVSHGLTYISGASPTQLGQLLEIRLLALSFTADEFEVDFDQVTLEATSVPEPSSFVLAGLGFLGVFCSRRRKQVVA